MNPAMRGGIRMSAAVSPALVPTRLREEGVQFWGQLVEECKNQIQSINRSLSDKDRNATDRVEYRADEQLSLRRSVCPSTIITVSIAFEHWGPIIRVRIAGHQTPELAFQPEEFELPLALDVDGSTVAIFDEGRSLRPREVACLLAQSFHRCFPGISFPCPDLVSE
jgi:hypothetical protein